MPRKLNLALVGAGRRGRGAHLPAILKLADVYNLTAVCDADEANLQEIAAQYGGLRTYTSVRDLVEHEELDVADVCVPADAHHAICCFLAEAGVNIIVETPISISLPLADLMIEAARRNKVKLEVAENYHRAPIERFKTALLEAGVIGEVSRIYRVFYEGGAHGMSMLRLRAGAPPLSILGVTHTTPVIPITDRMKRHHTEENWSLAYLDFANGASALMVYSNVVHARSLGRGQHGVSQIDATAGTIVGDAIYLVPPAELHSGAIAVPYEPQRITRQVNGEALLERIEVALPGQTLSWENLYAELGVGERQVALVDELMSIARAVLEDKTPTYGAAEARFDLEMDLAMHESGLRQKEVIRFPLSPMTETERQIHQNFEQEYGASPEEIDKLLDIFYPRL
jgi:predicted dehydrogenase